MTDSSKNQFGEQILPNRLSTEAGRKGILIPLGLLTVLAANICALLVPFLTIRFMGTKEYKLIESVKLMWEAKIYLVAFLIVGFSIIFPLFKTISLLIIWFTRMKPLRRNRFIQLLEAAGKWSMFDIFVVTLLMVISTNQVFINTEPRYGLFLFIIAIIGNMIMSRLMEMVDQRINFNHRARFGEDTAVLEPLTATGGLGWAMPLFLVIALISIVFAIEVPFFRINDIPLYSKSYSIHSAIAALFEKGNYGLASFLVLFTCVTPILVLVLIGHCWMVRKTHFQIAKRMDLIKIVGEWSMLSVFLMALGITVTEGQEMVKTQIKPGLYAIMVAILCSVVCTQLAYRKLRSMLVMHPAD
ncbi:MAG: paraquat-inducible protein A [Planctomycetota bacterium]|nr:paraquat-inducible protein A [Planctomycetota bacterium]